MPVLQGMYADLYDINLYIYRVLKDETIVDIRYYPRSSLDPGYRQQVADHSPMLHCKITLPPWLVDKKEKFDINWEHNPWLNKWKLFRAGRKLKRMQAPLFEQRSSGSQLLQQVISILLKVKANIADGSNCDWIYNKTPQQMRDEIDRYIAALREGNTEVLEELNVHFAATAAYQEHSIANGWSEEYLRLSEQFDNIYNALKVH